MSQYNIFEAIFMSFYSSDLYRDVGQNWGGKIFLYLFMLMLLVSAGSAIPMQISLNRIYKENADIVMAQLPIIKITAGKLSTPEVKPFLITLPSAKQPLLIIDTSGKYTNLTDTDGVALVTEKQIFIQHKEHETRIYQISKDYDGEYKPDKVNDYIKRFVSLAWIAIFLFLLIFYFIFRLLQALIYALIGKLYSVISGASVNYGTILQVTIMALTPALVLQTIMEIAGHTFPHHTLAYFLITMTYIIVGINANKTA